MITLHRLTTEYEAFEDRLRMSAETGDGAPVVLWLTRRMVRLLLDHLVGWLKTQGGAQALPALAQEFAQQAAQSSLQPSAPVQAAQDSVAWLVHEVDIALADHVVSLTFKSADGGSAQLLLETVPLRQWLAIVRRGSELGYWALPWPDWLTGVAPVPEGAVLH